MSQQKSKEMLSLAGLSASVRIVLATVLSSHCIFAMINHIATSQLRLLAQTLYHERKSPGLVLKAHEMQ